MAKKWQPAIKVRNYNDPWVNRLAAACQIIGEMKDDRERRAFFEWCKSTWQKDWPA